MVFDDTVDLAKQARYAMEFCALESCGKCTPCRLGSTRGMEVVDQIMREPVIADKMASADLLRDLCDTMTAGSLCALGGLTPLPVMSALRDFPEDFGLPARRKVLSAGRNRVDCASDQRQGFRYARASSEKTFTLEVDGREVTVPAGTSICARPPLPT